MTPEELDEARAIEAQRRWATSEQTGSSSWVVAARLAREGWTPPVDPDLLACREWMISQPCSPDYREAVLAGKWDLGTDTAGFLAGARYARERAQERAKALEGLLREIEPYSNFIPWFDLRDRFDALLKEHAP